MHIQFIRHATFVVEMKGIKFLVDPMLSDAGTMGPAANAANNLPNPLVALPPAVDLATLAAVDAVLITHTHRDHFDDAAINILPKHLPVLCQPADLGKITEAGFSNVIAITERLNWNGVEITRTGGMHGRGEMGVKMGPVSGYVLQAPGEPTLYITGDTVWCEEVASACEFDPSVIVAFSGGAEFLTGGQITMSEEDISTLAAAAPYSQIVAVHMEAWNHCLLKRDRLRQYVNEQGFGARVHIPADGTELSFTN